MFKRTLLTLVSALVFIPACASEDPAPADDNRIELSHVCVPSSDCDACESSCGRCLDLCFDAQMSGASLDCNASCTTNCNRDCSHHCDSCEETEASFSLTGKKDDALLAACRDAAECNDTTDTTCKQWAKVGSPQFTEYLGCVGAATCQQTDHCTLEPGKLGSESCSKLEQCDAQCPVETRESLNMLTHALHPSVVSAVSECFEKDCSYAITCYNSWVSAVFDF